MVIAEEDFFRGPNRCVIANGKVLVIEWTYLGGQDGEFLTYFRTPDEALADWWMNRRLLDNGNLTSKVKRLPQEIEDDLWNVDCASFETRFIDY